MSTSSKIWNRAVLGAVVMGAAASAGCSVIVGAPGPGPTTPDMPSESEADAQRRLAWREKQSAFDATFAPESKEFRDLAPALNDGADASVVARADDLRLRFVKHCIAESGWSSVACWNGTFARDITEKLSSIRLRLGDTVGAAAEFHTLASYPDLRSEDAKLAATKNAVSVEPAIRTSKELLALDTVDWESSVTAVSKSKTVATVAFKPRGGNHNGYTTCHEELGHDADGDLVINRPCVDVTTSVDPLVFVPPVTVPSTDVEGVAFKPEMQVLVVFPKKGKREGHALESWVNLDEADEFTHAIKRRFITFRGTHVQAAKPGLP